MFKKMAYVIIYKIIKTTTCIDTKEVMGFLAAKRLQVFLANFELFHIFLLLCG